MTAPAAIIASFVQPAAKLAMGDAVGGAMGGFEALLAMLTPSPQGVGGKPVEGGEPAPETNTPAETGDLAGLFGQAGAAAWMTQTLSQAPAKHPEESVTSATPQAKGPVVDAASVVAHTAAPQAAPTQAVPAEVAPTATGPTDAALATPTDAPGLEALLQRHAPEAVDQAILERREPVTGRTLAQTTQSTPQGPAPTASVQTADAPVAEAVVAAQVLASIQPTADAEVPAETVAAPTVITPPVEAKVQAPPRKAATTDAKAVKVETADAARAPTAIAAVDETVDAAGEELAPVEVAAHEAETPEAPARNAETTVQTLTAKLEAMAAGATTFANQVRAAPETVAKLAAGILDKLSGQSTKFDLQLDPHGLGKVDVSVEIASDGKLTAQLGFDSSVGLAELRGRAQELRTALEQAGFNLAEGALSFDFSGERRQQTADQQADRTDQAGKAFARALGVLDEELAAIPTRYQARRGLDLLI